MREAFCGRKVGQMVLPAPPGGSPASPNRQVNAPQAQNNDPPYFFVSVDFVADPIPFDKLQACGDGAPPSV